MSNITAISAGKPSALEFFAGIGLARLGLERAGFRVAWSNDYEPSKREMYDAHFRDDVRRTGHTFRLGDIGKLTGADLPTGASLAWASSPCTDLSLAGSRAGLGGSESSTFWEFVRILDELGDARPKVAVLENVVGLATSHTVAELAELFGVSVATVYRTIARSQPTPEGTRVA